MGIWGGKFRIGTQSEYVVLTIEHISKLHTDSYKIIESFQPLIHLLIDEKDTIKSLAVSVFGY